MWLCFCSFYITHIMTARSAFVEENILATVIVGVRDFSKPDIYHLSTECVPFLLHMHTTAAIA